MKVVKMTPSSRIKDRYYAELEDGTTIKVTVALIADYSIFTGRDFSEEELRELIDAAGLANAKARALRMVSARPMSRREVEDRLCEKGESRENAVEAADMLERIGAVNDNEYAAMIVRHYAAKGYGAGKIKNELYRRGIPEDLREEALLNMPDTEDKLDRLVETKMAGKTPDRKEIKKLTDMLVRRGFTWEEIRNAIRKYESLIGENFDD